MVEVSGSDRLEKLQIKDKLKGELREVEAAGLFIFIGAKPVTQWLTMDVIKDQRGFLETGVGLTKYDNYKKIWRKKRDPFLLETCTPGVFAAGDVRAGAMNRVASAVGEGAVAIKFVHEYLAEN